MCCIATANLGTKPIVLAFFVCIVSLFTGTAVPATVRTIFAVHQMPFFAFFTRPSRRARFIDRMRFKTAGANPDCMGAIPKRTLTTKHAGMLRSTGRTTPGILRKRILVRMNRIAVHARPTLALADSRRSPFAVIKPLLLKMNDFTLITPPCRLRYSERIRIRNYRTNRFFVFHIAFRTEPRSIRIRNGKPSDGYRHRKPF